MLNKLHLNSVHCDTGRHVRHGSQDRRHAALQRQTMQMAAELPPGTHNAQPFRDGVLFNDTEADALRYAGRGEGREDRALQGAALPRRALLNRRARPEPDRAPGFRARARACSRTPSSRAARHRRPSRSTTSPKNERLLSVNLTMDVRNAIHGLEVWPYD